MSGAITLGNLTLAPATAVVGLIALVLAVLLIVALAAWRRAAAGDNAARTEAAAGNAEMERRLAELMRAQGEIGGHVRGLAERLDGFGHRMGQSMSDTTRTTQQSLARLGERLAVIDKAQQTITALSSQVVELQHILADKQSRGAFGQGRMEAIIKDHLPPDAYAFQATLSNGTRPDCLIMLPNGGPNLAIDAKFPLEAWNGIRAAATPEALKGAEAQFRRDTIKHVQDIAARYLIPGETLETAFMFVPSESIFADMHERFEDVVQRAHRVRIVIVSPSLLMLSVQVVMSLLRDQRMREQTHLIQEEVMRLMEDIGRLDDRVRKLQMHFGQANKDVEDILISTRKVTGRGRKIEAAEFDGGEEEPALPARGGASERPGNGRQELPFGRDK